MFDELDIIEQALPSMPPFEVLRTYFNQEVEVCPTAMIDAEDLFMLETEQACREYHKLPFEGGLWDQPLKLLENFEVIRAERNQFERIRFEQLKRKEKVKENNQGPLARGNTDLPPRNRNLNG